MATELAPEITFCKRVAYMAKKKKRDFKSVGAVFDIKKNIQIYVQ